MCPMDVVGCEPPDDEAAASGEGTLERWGMACTTGTRSFPLAHSGLAFVCLPRVSGRLTTRVPSPARMRSPQLTILTALALMALLSSRPAVAQFLQQGPKLVGASVEGRGQLGVSVSNLGRWEHSPGRRPVCRQWGRVGVDAKRRRLDAQREAPRLWRRQRFGTRIVGVDLGRREHGAGWRTFP